MREFIRWVACASLLIGLVCAIIVATDILRGRRQKMWIMNIVWPVTSLWSGALGLFGYWRWGRAPLHKSGDGTPFANPTGDSKQSFPIVVAKSATHCGAGCTLGDLIAESFAVLVPLSFFGYRIFGSWIYDFIAAFVLGIAFQYFTIKPMRDVSVKQGIIAALKADTLSLTAWQLGMYGWMAVVRFGIVGHEIAKSNPLFWFQMQIAMCFGFATSYPVNWWLLRNGLKERM